MGVSIIDYVDKLQAHLQMVQIFCASSLSAHPCSEDGRVWTSW